MQLVEGVEEALLGLLLAADKLDIIYQQHINKAVFSAELAGAPGLDGTDELVGELLGADIERLDVFGLRQVIYGVHEVALAQAHTPVDEQRIVAGSRLFGDAAGGGVG
ncbi:hypothetical protein ES707_06218 [subsurface metagenome]